jgi:transcriptional regulator with XRE-family HTH domain
MGRHDRSNVGAKNAGLGEFLRARRSGLHPAQFGLPADGRRRVPGLRREEVAALANISSEYLGRLEQGRGRHPSPPVLRALSSALALSGTERDYLHLLAAAQPSELDCTRSRSGQIPSIDGTHLLEALHGTPALVLGRGTRVLAQNDATTSLAGNLVSQTVIESLFSNQRLRQHLIVWEESAAYWVSFLRTHTLRDGGDRDLCHLIRTLQQHDSDFARLWAQHEPLREASGNEIFIRRPDSSAAFHRQVLPLATPEQWLLVLTENDAVRDHSEKLGPHLKAHKSRTFDQKVAGSRENSPT